MNTVHTAIWLLAASVVSLSLGLTFQNFRLSEALLGVAIGLAAAGVFVAVRMM